MLILEYLRSVHQTSKKTASKLRLSSFSVHTCGFCVYRADKGACGFGQLKVLLSGEVQEHPNPQSS
jgi:hypothetical protein